MNKKYVTTYSPFVLAFYQNGIASVALLPFFVYTSTVFQINDILLLILLGVLFTGVSHSLFIKGMTHVKAQLASIIATLEPVYGIILAIIILGEGLQFNIIIGGIVILGSVFYATKISKD